MLNMDTPAGYEIPAGAWLAQFTRAFFGHETTIQESNPTVTATAAEVLKNNPRRFGWLIFNLGVTQVSFAFNGAPTTSAGFPLQALGGGASVTAMEDGELCGLSLSAVSISGSNKLYVLEVVGV